MRCLRYLLHLRCSTMTDKTTSVVPLNSGLDLASPKLLVEPGSLLSCLNYEIVDRMGYKRIDGFMRYDGHLSLKDIPSLKVIEVEVNANMTVEDAGGLAGVPFEDSFGNVVGIIFQGTDSDTPNEATLRLISFIGDYSPSGTAGSYVFTSTAFIGETGYTWGDFQLFQSYFSTLVDEPPQTPIGLHWFDDRLRAVIPLNMIAYEASDVNQTVNYNVGSQLASTYLGGNTVTLLAKVVTRAATASLTERGYFVVGHDTSGGPYANPEPDANATYTLSGAVSVGAGSIYHQTGGKYGTQSDYADIWTAQRPSLYTSNNKALSIQGWVQPTDLFRTFDLTVTLSGVTTPLKTLRKNDTVAASTYYFSAGGGDVLSAVVLDYFIESGAFDTGNAVLRLQVTNRLTVSGTPSNDITTAMDMYSDSIASTKIADVTTRMSFTGLPGLPLLKANKSRYEMKTSNFYGSDDMEAVYGVNGAGRAFIFDGTYLSHVWTQLDANLDKPRHVANHAQHLALGFENGSVVFSVPGEPANFLGIEGASEVAVGDSVTGLMELKGSTLGVFCEQSVRAIVGTVAEDFQAQIVAPNTGCIEYTLADCGFPVYADARGISTLEASEKYGDFMGVRLSAKVSPWLLPRLRTSVLGYNNSAGVACALPIREKNQYRLFFNDGNILTMTFISNPEGGTSIGFTTQKYFVRQDNPPLPNPNDNTDCLIAVAASSQVDSDGVERVFVSHYSEDAWFTSKHVYALDCGDSFDGDHIPYEAEINWYFDDRADKFVTVTGIRMYGLTKGRAEMNVYARGIENDFIYPGAAFSTSGVPMNLPRTSADLDLRTDFVPVTNRGDISVRGLATQFKVRDSATELVDTEPAHILQVLVVNASPDGAFDH